MSQASSEEAARVIVMLLAASTRDLTVFIKEFYRVNQRWPADVAEFKSSSFGKLNLWAPYENLKIVENDAGNCLLTYSNKYQRYEAQITIFRPAERREQGPETQAKP